MGILAISQFRYQVPRENLVMIGVPCQGIIDLTKLEAAVDGEEVLHSPSTSRRVLKTRRHSSSAAP